MKKTQVPQSGLIQLNLIQQQKKVFLSNMMNFYPVVYEEQGLQDLLEHQVIDSNEQLNYYEYEQSQQHELEQLNTFDGYLQEEPVLLFNYVEEAPKKKSKQIIRRSKKIRKADSETDVYSVNQEKKRRINNDVLKLQQCQKLKTIISQMESLLQLTRTKILNQYLKSQTK